MTLQLFDLAGADDAVRFSPFCWRTKMALKHKGLDFEALAWRFTEKDRLAATNQGRVPVLIDGDRHVCDSWSIATYLDETYPDRPMLMKDEAATAAARLTQAWADGTLFGPLRPIAVKRVWDILGETDQSYFRETREKALGASLEDVSSDAAVADGYKALSKTVKPLEAVLLEHAFLGGDAPYYGDYIVFGTLMWPHTISSKHALDGDLATAAWFERMLDLFDGYARNAPRAAA